MSLPREAIDRARQVNILPTAQRFVILKRVAANQWAGPCPGCGGDDRFRLNPKKQAFLCRQCGAKGKGSIDIVMLALGCDFRAALEQLEGPLPAAPKEPAKSERPPSDADLLKSASLIVSQLAPLAGTPGEAFLRKVRRIDCDAIADVLAEPYAIGWHSALYFSQPDPEEPFHELHGKRLGAIVAILTDPVTALPTGAISRTYIGPDGAKIGKAKSLAGSGIVRLSRDEDVLEGLHLTEGLESALFGMAIGFRPMWSTGSTSQLKAFPTLAGITRLTIFADRDPSGVGEGAALEVDRRWREAGAGKVRVRRIKDGFGDLNDLGRTD
jgi:hypothetical protein